MKDDYKYLKERNLKNKIINFLDVVNKYKEAELVKIFSEYGEERLAKSIARNICLYRNDKEIVTTNELVKIIENYKSIIFLEEIFEKLKIWFAGWNYEEKMVGCFYEY